MYGLHGSGTESGTDPLEQNFVVEWLFEESEGAGVHSAHSRHCISVCRNENDRYPSVVFRQFGLKLQTVHPRHFDVSNQASSFTSFAVSQEFLR
jgi:hypothetical protein